MFDEYQSEDLKWAIAGRNAGRNARGQALDRKGLKHKRPDLAAAEEELWQHFLTEMKSKQHRIAGILETVQESARSAVDTTDKV